MSPSNQFDRQNYPSTEPAELIAGDRWVWKRADLAAYDPNLYDLKYSARQEVTGAEIEIVAIADGVNFVIEVPAATTEKEKSGRYHWQAYIIRKSDSERITISNGRFEIAPNRDTSSDDPRSVVRKAIDKIDAWLGGNKSPDVAEYQLAGRAMKYWDPEKLLVYRSKLLREVAAEENAERIRRGLGTRNKLRVRFTR